MWYGEEPGVSNRVRNWNSGILAIFGMVLVSHLPAALNVSGPLADEGDRLSSYLNSPPDLSSLLVALGEKAAVYEEVALQFVCIETIIDHDDPRRRRLFDYMYVEAEEQRYRPFRQKHTGRPGTGVQEKSIRFAFPDSYSWTLMFSPDRQHLFHFRYLGTEWFSLRLAHIIEFTAPLPFTNGETVYQWSGQVWIDAENYNFLKVEAEPGNQTDRMKKELDIYRRAPRFLGFPLGKKPHGSTYNITFLNEFQKLSLPDQAEHTVFVINVQGEQEWEDRQILRYSGYQFFGVKVRDKFLR